MTSRTTQLDSAGATHLPSPPQPPVRKSGRLVFAGTRLARKEGPVGGGSTGPKVCEQLLRPCGTASEDGCRGPPVLGRLGSALLLARASIPFAVRCSRVILIEAARFYSEPPLIETRAPPSRVRPGWAILHPTCSVSGAPRSSESMPVTPDPVPPSRLSSARPWRPW